MGKIKKALLVATVGRFFEAFECNDIKILQSMGYEVHCAANFSLTEQDDFRELGIIQHQVDFARKPFRKENITAYHQVKKLLQETSFDLLHCHTPVSSAIARLAARKYRKAGMKVIYTAHGFPFSKEASLKNWLLYYPVEWLCSFWTDEIVTINKTDYALAQKHMHAGHVTYIPGVGVDLKKFSLQLFTDSEIAAARAELGVAADEKMLLSVGELSQRKNHEAVIRALAKRNNLKIKYFICGTGQLTEYLTKFAKELGLAENVKLLGYRTDIAKLCDCADLFVFPSLSEGLPVALMEAIASKTPVICSNIRGNTDLIGEGALFGAKNIEQISEKIGEYLDRDNSAEIERNYCVLKDFDLENVSQEMKAVYSEWGGVTYLGRLYECQQLRKEMSVSADTFILLSVGELQERKNHIVVLKALAELQEPRIMYLIAGEGRLRSTYQQTIESSGLTENVKLLGHRKDITALCAAADCFVHPSVIEGLGIAPLEAMACGLPLIAANVGGIKDYAVEGVTGCCVNPHSVEEMKNAILKMYKDKAFRDKCGKNNVQAAKPFDIKNTDRIMRELYSHI